MRKIILFVLLILCCLFIPSAMRPEYYDVVVYGGGFSGCAAAARAAEYAAEKKILLIIPEPIGQMGGLGTVGGQNFTDIRLWSGELVTQGSFARWYNEAGQFYSTEKMAEIIKNDLQRFANLEIIYAHDILRVKTSDSLIREIYIKPVRRMDNGDTAWNGGTKNIAAHLFIDASDEGRLARLAEVPLTVGRQDWPAEYLSEIENTTGVAHQQAATLMFKVTGVSVPVAAGQIGDWFFTKDKKGSWGLAGGKNIWANNPQVLEFNKRYSSAGFAVKPFNAAQNGTGSSEWWVNMLLVFDVDARARTLDLETSRYPQDMLPGARTVEEAWQAARDFLQNADFLQTLRQFEVKSGDASFGFAEAQLVLDKEGNPVTGDTLYLRESVHSWSEKALPLEAADKLDYALSAIEAQQAGADSRVGGDQENYPDRIGLGYYMMDINAYQPEDIINNDRPQWPVTQVLRPDWLASGGEPKNPVYLPFSMLVNQKIQNLLLPGYAAGCSSLAWAELRVLPNLTVLGDAAGIAAARAVNYGENPAAFDAEQISWVQERLLDMGARLEK
ncbi:MAG: FAD-dependent oxidoreductase [Desulfocucumaceae bacterium]